VRILFRTLAYVVVPTAAFLTFMLQPIVGKQLMPRYGGTAGTWMTVSFFFQAALLGGYALAFWLLRQRRVVAYRVAAGIAVLAAVSLRLPPWHFDWAEWPALIAGLTLSALPTVLLTTSIGILLQGWLRETDGRVPYWLYGISNLGSMLALVLYPFVIEPLLGLDRQVALVRGLLCALSALTLLLILLHRRSPASAPENQEEGNDEHLPWTRLAAWASIAFLTCTLMLGAVGILSAEIGSNPLSWLLPLGIYLLSFSITFSGWWRPPLTMLMVAGLSLAFYGYMSTKGISASVLKEWPRVWLVGLVACGTLGGHGFLYQLRPARRFSLFYLVLGAAGMAAGLFASVGAPLVFNRNVEFVLAAAALLVIATLALLSPRGIVPRAVLLLMVLGPAGWYAVQTLWQESRRQVTRVSYHRNHYGTVVLTEGPAYVSASNETTLHGVQLLLPTEKNTPTSYYTRGSGGGMVMEHLQREFPSLKVGVVGLGIGTLSAYSRPGDYMVFWDINPLVVRMAREKFTFLSDARGSVEVRLGDGRIGLRNAPEKFDLIVIDAFSGDYIPLHLVTREAMAEYRDKAPGGLLLFHVSNRYVDLAPVLGTNALSLGLASRQLIANPNSLNKNADQPAKTKYILVFPPDQAGKIDRWIEGHTTRGDYDFEVSDPAVSSPVLWTDNRHAIAEIL
jgi:hypothetical protein